jgi:hypothetical protein
VVTGGIANTRSREFDYEVLPPDVVPKARQAAERIRDLRCIEITAMLEAGRVLLAMKEELEYGLFLKWVEAKAGCAMNKRTAQNYMRAALFVGDDGNEMVSHLHATTLYDLDAAPEMIKAHLRCRLLAGERLTDTEIRRAIAIAKPKRTKKASPRKKGEVDIIPPPRPRFTEHDNAAQWIWLIAMGRAVYEGDQAGRRDRAQQAAEILAKRLGSELDRFVQLTKDLSLTEILDNLSTVPRQTKPKPVAALPPPPMAGLWETGGSSGEKS